MSTLIELHDITKIYPNAQGVIALKSVNLQLEHADMLGIVGIENSGKSTLLNILALSEHPSCGEYYYNQQSTNKISFKERVHIRNNQFGFIAHTHFLLPHLDILKNIIVSLRHRGISTENAMVAALDVMKKVGLQHKLNCMPHELSEIEKHYITIARAIANQPTIIFADDPTRNLDDETTKKIFNLLITLQQAENFTIIITARNKNIAKYCKCIHLL